MKKLLTGILATSMCLACLTACGGDNKVETDLDGAVANLEAIYQDRDVEVSRDYDVLNSILYDGQTYTITWSVDVTEGVKIVAGATSTTVDVNEVSATDISYVLTATVTDANGDTKTVSFNRVVKAASEKVAAPIQSAPEEDTAYKLYVYQTTKQQDCYFVGEMSKYYFKTSENSEEAVDIYVEYKADSETEFYPYFLDANETKQYIGMKVSSDGGHNNIVYETEPVSPFVWNDDLNTITTTIIDRDGNETEFFLGNYSTYVTFQGSAISYAETSNIGYLIGMIDRNSVPAAEKVSQEKKVLTAPKAFVGEASYELSSLGITYADVTITWAVEGEGASVSGNVLTVAAGDDTSTVKLTATLTCGDASDTATFDVMLVPNDPAKIMAAGNAIGEGGKIANEVTLTGVVTNIADADKYDPQYGNVSVTIDVNGTSVYCYRIAGAGADVLTEGYTVTVKGYIENFKGSAQIGQGGTIVDYVEGEAPEVPEDSSSEVPDDSSSSEDVSTPDDGETKTITVSIADYADANGWTNSTLYASIKMNDAITVTSSGTPYGEYGLNTGKYYENGENWRIYQKESPSVTISAAEGTTIISVKITYSIKNDGTLTYNSANVASDEVVVVNANSITFSVANTGDKTNGQAQITAIEVIYA